MRGGYKMEITKSKFEEMFFSMTNKEMANKLNVSELTVRNYARKLNLRKRQGFNTKPKLKIIEG